MFPTKHRVPKSLIKKVISDGEKHYSELFLIKKLKNNLDVYRFGVVVSKKVSNSAVKRHLIKRRVINSIRENVDKFDNGYDYVVITSSKILNSSFEEINNEVSSLS